MKYLYLNNRRLYLPSHLSCYQCNQTIYCTIHLIKKGIKQFHEYFSPICSPRAYSTVCVCLLCNHVRSHPEADAGVDRPAHIERSGDSSYG